MGPVVISSSVLIVVVVVVVVAVRVKWQYTSIYIKGIYITTKIIMTNDILLYSTSIFKSALTFQSRDRQPGT